MIVGTIVKITGPRLGSGEVAWTSGMNKFIGMKARIANVSYFKDNGYGQMYLLKDLKGEWLKTEKVMPYTFVNSWLMEVGNE